MRPAEEVYVPTAQAVHSVTPAVAEYLPAGQSHSSSAPVASPVPSESDALHAYLPANACVSPVAAEAASAPPIEA